MASLSGKRLTTLAVSGGIATLLLIPQVGIPVNAQTSEETNETEGLPEPTDAENEEANPESDTVEPAGDVNTPATPRFTCQLNNGQYTVMYNPESQPEQAYAWAIPGDMGSNWPAHDLVAFPAESWHSKQRPANAAQSALMEGQ